MKRIATALLTVSLSLATTSALWAGDAPAAAPTCQKRPFKEVKSVTPFSLTHRVNSKKIHYDDISCGLKWRTKQCSSIQGGFDTGAMVYDFNTLAEITINQATFVQSPAIQSPMGSGVAAFATQADADAFLAQKGAGKKLSYQELLLIEWP